MIAELQLQLGPRCRLLRHWKRIQAVDTSAGIRMNSLKNSKGQSRLAPRNAQIHKFTGGSFAFVFILVCILSKAGHSESSALALDR